MKRIILIFLFFTPLMVFGQRETIMTQDTIILYGDTIIVHEPWDRTMHDPWYPMGFPDDYVKEPTFEEKLNSLLQDYKQYCITDSIVVWEQWITDVDRIKTDTITDWTYIQPLKTIYYYEPRDITFEGFIEWMENKTKNK